MGIFQNKALKVQKKLHRRKKFVNIISLQKEVQEGFYTAKETINKMKRQPTEWEKIFANDMTSERLKCKK